MAKQKVSIGNEGIYDARTLGKPRMVVLGLQHMFAMFGATVLVPVLTGLSVSATLLFAGLGTLLFHLITKGKVPAFLGSSFAFLGGYAAITTWEELNTVTGEMEAVLHPQMLPYACVGVACAGLVYLVLAGLFKAFGPHKVMRYFPPIVTGPIIICIGLILANSAINNCQSNWWIALLAIAVVVVLNIWGKGMLKIVPILMGVLISYVVAAICGLVDFTSVGEAAWFGLPFDMKDTVFSIFGDANSVVYKGETISRGSMIITSIITIMPIALATIIEHIGDVCAISSTTENNFIEDPGLHRTLMGDGIATTVAALFGAPANTTYGENTGVLALTRVYDPRVIRIAALFAILFSFCPKFAALISAMPAATIGGVSLILYGMISAVGVRNLVENQVNFAKSRNVLICAIIMGLALGINFSAAGAIAFNIGHITISLSGLAVAAIVGIALNAILPGKDYTFGANPEGDKAVNFKV
ncbi:MAG: uracil-xanthine permease family protein [Eubacteriales bacterium]|nr:uracil-xanthine permease family protein [Eubacteriales bacterium]MDD3882981.1 uracil-xanthine permease family protein [Eubacteriales bacterium]MDD4513472.1 uracil-xanthine permease family protein [Eubacteriales bacterium]